MPTSGLLTAILVLALTLGVNAPTSGATEVRSTSPAAAAREVYPGLGLTPVLTGLEQPMTLAFDAAGHIFLALKPGVVVRYDRPGDANPVTVLDIRNDVYDFADKGLLGMVLDPAFDRGRPYLYLLHSYDKDPFGPPVVPRWGSASGGDGCPDPPGIFTGCTSTSRLVRYTIRPDGTADPSSQRVILDGSADPAVGGWCDQVSSHSIGSIRFGPEGMLYAGSGDGAFFGVLDYGQLGDPTGPTPPNPCNDGPGVRGTVPVQSTSLGGALRAQAVRGATATSPVKWNGAILRLNPDTGAAATGNPLIGNGIANDDRIVAYGLRNPFRFAFRPATNQLWIGDVGQAAYEEIDRFTTGPGQANVPNFGWPCYEGTGRQPRYDLGQIDLCEQLYETPVQTLGGVRSPLTQPFLTWPRSATEPAAGCRTTGGGAVVGGQFLSGPTWPTGLRGAYVFADYVRGCLVAIPAKADGTLDPSARTALVTDIDPVAIESGPDGALYVVDVVAGAVLRLATRTTNPPVAAFTATPDGGPLPLSVSFDASSSSDPENDPLTYGWDLDGDGTCDDATGVTASWTYTSRATVRVQLCVTDGTGLSVTATRLVHADNADPTVGASASSGTAGWAVGDPITFTARGADPDDPLGPTAYSWVVELRHCVDEADTSCHSHPYASGTGATLSIEAPDHEYYAYLRAVVTVTDPVGGRAEATVDARPRVSTVTLATNPAGIPGVNVGYASGTAPQSAKVLENGIAQLIVPATATLAGTTYTFGGWSDKETSGTTRTIHALPGARRYTANYVQAGAPPAISAVTGSPAVVNLPRSGSRKVVVTARVADPDRVSRVVAILVSPNGKRTTAVMSRVSGTVRDGGYRGWVTLVGSTAASGTYRVEIRATDATGRTGIRRGPTIKVTVTG